MSRPFLNVFYSVGSSVLVMLSQVISICVSSFCTTSSQKVANQIHTRFVAHHLMPHIVAAGASLRTHTSISILRNILPPGASTRGLHHRTGLAVRQVAALPSSAMAPPEGPPGTSGENSQQASHRGRRRGRNGKGVSAKDPDTVTGSGQAVQPTAGAPAPNMAATALAAASAALHSQDAPPGTSKFPRKRGGRGRGNAPDQTQPNSLQPQAGAPALQARQFATQAAPQQGHPPPRNGSTAPSAPKPDDATLRFADIPGLSTPTRRALQEDFGYECATPVQAATIAPAITGQDLLARARTGTGKTLAFGLPTIERIARNPDLQRHPKAIRAVIVSPTRELANQIAAELGRVAAFHGRHFGVQVVVGGTNRSAEHRRMQQGPNTILVCTPGRFHDHCENSAGFTDLLRTTEVAVLDECDRLLEMGFRAEVVKLLRMLPDVNARQTLLYSATLPSNLSDITSLALRAAHEYVDCVGTATETAHAARQYAAVVPKDAWLYRLAEVISEGTTTENAKIMVFCQTARTAAFLSQFFRVAGLPGVLEIHSRMSQPARTRASNAFRAAATGAVLFTSDVSARGVDYPDTTLIIQLGATTDRETYVHRLGRTARAGTSGEGLLLLTEDEAPFLTKTLKGLPIEDKVLGPLPREGEYEWADAVAATLGSVPRDEELKRRAELCYGAWLGFMNGLKLLRWSKEQLVAEANLFARQIGLKEQPRLEKKTVGKMGLKGVPGLLYKTGGG
eukprot:jgi/Ulvmu1/11391/UM075_0053.1